MEVLLLLAGIVLFFVCRTICRDLLILSQPWRVKVLRDTDNANTVKVVLQKRWTVDEGYGGYGSTAPNRIVIKDGIVVNTDDPREFKLRLRSAIQQAEDHATALHAGEKMTRKRLRLREDKP